jgi:hypothetical protein
MFEVYLVGDHSNSSYSMTPGIMDFLRTAALVKGRVLFVEGDEYWKGS